LDNERPARELQLAFQFFPSCCHTIIAALVQANMLPALLSILSQLLSSATEMTSHASLKSLSILSQLLFFGKPPRPLRDLAAFNSFPVAVRLAPCTGAGSSSYSSFNSFPVAVKCNKVERSEERVDLRAFNSFPVAVRTT